MLEFESTSGTVVTKMDTRQNADAQHEPRTDSAAEITRLRSLWIEQEKQAAERRAVALREKLAQRKSDLVAGAWRPHACTCDTCLRAILELNPERLCAIGRTETWW